MPSGRAASSGKTRKRDSRNNSNLRRPRRDARSKDFPYKSKSSIAGAASAVLTGGPKHLVGLHREPKTLPDLPSKKSTFRPKQTSDRADPRTVSGHRPGKDPPRTGLHAHVEETIIG
jgi:hypothetical protein